MICLPESHINEQILSLHNIIKVEWNKHILNIHEILKDFGFTDIENCIYYLSNEQKIKLLLVKTLLEKPDIILIETDSFNFETIQMLIEYLKKYKNTIIFRTNYF